MENFYLSYLLILIIFLLGCESDKKQVAESDVSFEKNDIIFQDLTDKYDIKYSLDTLIYQHSIEFEDMLNADYQMLSKFSIHDIYRKNGSLYISIKAGSIPIYFLRLRISEADLSYLQEQDRPRQFRSSTALIVNLNMIKKFDFTFESYYEGDDFYAIEVEDSRSFLGTGQIVDIQHLDD